MGYCINSLPAKPQTSPLLTLAAEFLEDYILPAIRIQPGDKIQIKTKIKTRSFQTLMHKLILLTTEVSDWGCNYFFINLLVSSGLKKFDSTFKATEELLTLRITNNWFWLFTNTSHKKTIFSVSDKIYTKPRQNKITCP